MMEKEKQIEEMARFVCSSFHGHHDCENCSLYEERCCVSFCAAKRLYNAGYRKQSEGEWVTKGDFFKTYHCSLCNYSVDYPWQRTSYCPRCGAKMGGGAE